jgi:drug/metabolite transporter (DMT)-like permease
VPYFLALVAGALCISEGAIIFKLIPKSDLVALNAIAVSAGSVLLLGLSVMAGEAWELPAAPGTWAALAYLILAGSVILFYLYLFVLARWDASATAYSFLLFPVATVIVAALLLGEAVGVPFIAGGALVLVGVWLGGQEDGRSPHGVCAQAHALRGRMTACGAHGAQYPQAVE